MRALLSVARPLGRKVTAAIRRAKPSNQANFTAASPIPREKTLQVMNFLLTVLGLVFWLTKHSKHCASPCAIPVSMLPACPAQECF